MPNSSPEICIIAALAEKNRVIGKDGKIPWHISADLKRFRDLTTPHPIIMGSKTFGSIGRALPQRMNIVVSRHLSPEAMNSGNLVVEKSLEDALNSARRADKERIFIMGGGEIYSQTIDQADRLFLTLVEGTFEGDTFFPDYSEFKKVIFEENHESDGLKYKFLELER